MSVKIGFYGAAGDAKRNPALLAKVLGVERGSDCWQYNRSSASKGASERFASGKEYLGCL